MSRRCRAIVWLLIAVLLSCIVLSVVCQAQDEAVRVVTWNLEHFGGAGRGFGGIGSGELGARGAPEVEAIAELLRDTIEADLVAIQEVSVSSVTAAGAESAKLEELRAALGADWRYQVARPQGGIIASNPVHNMCNAFLWNATAVRLIRALELDFPNERVGGESLFSRAPLIGYFEALRGGTGTNDFVLVNVHLKSGQDNWANHLVACVIIEQYLAHTLDDVPGPGISERERIILGDFNDDPYANGGLVNGYFEERGWTDLVKPWQRFTRMNAGLSSLIDHVLVSRNARGDIIDQQATIRRADDMSMSGLTGYRGTYSDHFPVYFDVRVLEEDNDGD